MARRKGKKKVLKKYIKKFGEKKNQSAVPRGAI
jgi:hypothetical protein